MTGLRSTLLKLVVFGTVSVVGFIGLFAMMTNSVGGDSARWTAVFDSVSGLREGDDVRVAGVKVGRVERIEVVDNDQALVGFEVPRRMRFHEDTQLTLRYQNLLGQRYLAVDRPDGGEGAALEPDDRIPVSRTSPGFDLTALLNGFEPLFAVIDPGEVNQLATNILRVLQGEAGTVESLLEQTTEVTRFLAERDELFAQVLANLTPVLENLDNQSEQLDATVVQLEALMTGLADERRTVAGSIDHLGSLVANTSDLLDDVRAPLQRDVHALRRTTGLLARERPLLGRTLEDLPRLLGSFARTQSYGAYLNVYLCNLGFEAAGQRVWVPSAGGPYSGACT